MNDFFDRIASLRPASKLGIVLLMLGLVFGGYWYFFYSDMSDEFDRNQRKIAELKDEEHGYELRKQQYNAFKMEVANLLEEQKEQLNALPKGDDIEQFIESVNAQVELSGLSKVSSVREKEVPDEMYVRIPVKMSLTGTFHQIARFFKSVGEMKRIVNIVDLSLSPAERATSQESEATADNLLKAEFVAQTFQFPDRPAQAAQARPAGGAQ